MSCNSNNSKKDSYVDEDLDTQQNFWRLINTYSELYPRKIKTFRTDNNSSGLIIKLNIENASVVYYDENYEVASIEDYYVQPSFYARQIIDGEIVNETKISRNDIFDYARMPDFEVIIEDEKVISGSFEEPHFAIGEIIQRSTIENDTASKWSEHNYLKFKRDNSTDQSMICLPENDRESPECIGVNWRGQTTRYKDFGHITFKHAHVDEMWVTSDNPRTGQFTQFQDQIPEIPLDIKYFPIRRDYDSEGRLISSQIEGADDENKTVLKYTTGSALEKVSFATEFTDFISLEDQETQPKAFMFHEYRYHYQANGKVKVEYFSGLDKASLSKIGETFAIYKQGQCGPITLERSKKFIPHPFPVCFTR